MKQTTLLFLRRDDQILLAMKKRGFGVGKWNGAGGKVEEGETITEAAIRECQEEIGVTPNKLIPAGEFHFIDLPDVEHYCNIFVVHDWTGDPVESEEMRPQWFHKDEIPYDEMWADDKHWMPLLLESKQFKGKVVINEDGTIRQCDLAEVAEL